MMARHAAPVLVRLWPYGYTSDSINALVSDWNKGRFTLPAEHPLSRAVWPLVGGGALRLTVFSTEELEWALDMAELIGDRCRFTCIPSRDRLRHSLRADEWLIEQGAVS